MIQDNQFIILRNRVRKAVDAYKKALSDCAIKEKWHSETIYRMANPFLNGFFTLAVVGKMSSGKSTFINTLIGADLLPTGHFQTTSAITYIENGAKPTLKVIFADGKEKVFAGDNIRAELRKLVAVPEEFSALPINDINILIAGGDDENEILRKKEGIEAKTKSPERHKEEWIRYIRSHGKSTIPEEVHIYYPLGTALQGWRIVDTPGVGAIGGIQDETKKLFDKRDSNGAKVVDAIIFLQRGDDNIEDYTNVEFVGNTFNDLTDEAKERLFFVLTHATTQKFRQHKEDILIKAKTLYGDPYKIPAERLTYIDSLMAKFHDDVVKTGIDLSSIDPDDAEPLEGWTQEDSDVIYELFSPLKKELKNRQLPKNNNTMRDLMQEWGNFHSLHEIINNFVSQVKKSAYEKIISLIMTDYKNIISKYEHEIELLNGGEAAIRKERERLTRKKNEYNLLLSKLRRSAQYSTIAKKFNFVDEELNKLSEKKSIAEVRTTYLNIMDRAIQEQKRIFESLESDFAEFCKELDPKDIVLSQIDFNSIENEAEKKSSEYVTDYSRSKTETYKTGTVSPKTHTRTTYPYTKLKVEFDKKLREFKTVVLKKARSIRDSFMTQLEKKTIILCDIVESDIEEKTKNLEKRLSEMELNLQNKIKEIESINAKKQTIQDALKSANE